MFGRIYILGLSILTSIRFSLLNLSNFILACMEGKIKNKENIVSKKFLLIQC